MSEVVGLSVLDLLWQKLDEVVDALDEGEPEKWADEHVRGKDPQDHSGVASEWMEWGELRGRAQGLAQAIALLMNPYAPDVDAVRDQAMDRFDARHQEK
jgi:hypothetical protein